MRRQVYALVLLGVVQQNGLIGSVYDVLYQHDSIFKEEVHMVLDGLAFLLLLEDEKVNRLAQMTKGHLDHLLGLFGKLISDQVSFGVDKFVNEDFHVLENNGTKNAIIGDSDCLKLVQVKFVTLENGYVAGAVLGARVRHR